MHPSAALPLQRYSVVGHPVIRVRILRGSAARSPRNPSQILRLQFGPQNWVTMPISTGAPPRGTIHLPTFFLVHPPAYAVPCHLEGPALVPYRHPRFICIQDSGWPSPLGRTFPVGRLVKKGRITNLDLRAIESHVIFQQASNLATGDFRHKSALRHHSGLPLLYELPRKRGTLC